MNVAEYLSTLQSLLPLGYAWPQEPDAVLSRLLEALAAEFGRVDGRAMVLVERESDPRSTLELLPDWERAHGLPDPCTGLLPAIEQRQAALHAKVTGVGGQSRQYFLDLAARLGFAITITEFRAHNVGLSVADPLCGPLWQFVWRVNSAEATIGEHRVTGGVNEPLRWWGNALLECAITRLKPAHTLVQFSYGGSSGT